MATYLILSAEDPRGEAVSSQEGPSLTWASTAAVLPHLTRFSHHARRLRACQSPASLELRRATLLSPPSMALGTSPPLAAAAAAATMEPQREPTRKTPYMPGQPGYSQGWQGLARRFLNCIVETPLM